MHACSTVAHMLCIYVSAIDPSRSSLAPDAAAAALRCSHSARDFALGAITAAPPSGCDFSVSAHYWLRCTAAGLSPRSFLLRCDFGLLLGFVGLLRARCISRCVQVAARKTRRATRRTIFKRAESYVKEVNEMRRTELPGSLQLRPNSPPSSPPAVRRQPWRCLHRLQLEADDVAVTLSLRLGIVLTRALFCFRRVFPVPHQGALSGARSPSGPERRQLLC